MKLLRTLGALILLSGGTLVAQSPSPPAVANPKIMLELGKKILEVAVASTPEQRALGLMWRTSLGPNEGMLFVFDYPQQVVFWMKNTFIPLSIAYINPSGIIMEIYDMKPLSEDSIQSTSSAVLYALEMPKGWFEKNNIHPETMIQGLP